MPAAPGLPRQGGGDLGWLAKAGDEGSGVQVRDFQPLLSGKGAGRTSPGLALGQWGLTLRELGRRVRHDFDGWDPDWLYTAVESLRKDGLAKMASEPQAGASEMVAEERTSHNAGSEESQTPA